MNRKRWRIGCTISSPLVRLRQRTTAAKSRLDRRGPVMYGRSFELRRFGETRSYGSGERIIRAGDVAPGLIVILSGKVEITQGHGLDQREIIVTHEPRQFVGELAQLSARPSLVDA